MTSSPLLSLEKSSSLPELSFAAVCLLFRIVWDVEIFFGQEFMYNRCCRWGLQPTRGTNDRY